MTDGSSDDAAPGTSIEAWPADVDLLEQRLREAEIHRSHQLTWWLMGVTPAALLPIMAALWSDNFALAVVFAVAAMLIQTVRWWRASQEVDALESELIEARALRPEPANDSSG